MKRRQEEKTKKELEIKVEKRKTVSSIEILKTNKRMECYLLSDMIVSGKFQPNLFYLISLLQTTFRIAIQYLKQFCRCLMKNS